MMSPAIQEHRAPFRVELTLNDSLRFDRPSYTVKITTQVVLKVPVTNPNNSVHRARSRERALQDAVQQSLAANNE